MAKTESLLIFVEQKLSSGPMWNLIILSTYARVPASRTSLVEPAVELPRSAWTATRRSSVRGTQALALEELF